MERFNLDTWLKDKSRKVIDEDGFLVEIIKWDANEKCPVVCLNHNGMAYNVSVDGMYDSDPNHGIFFADNELTEFEKAVEKTMPYRIPIYMLKSISQQLLDLAREEFIPKKQYNEDLEQAYKNVDKVQFNRGMDEVLTNPQKYFHVGDTIRLKNSNAEHTITSIFNGRYYGEGWSLDILKSADDYELVEDCNEISNKIDYSSEIIGFLKNYIKAHGCTAMNSWVKWLENKMTPQEREVYNAHKKRMERFTEKIDHEHYQEMQ